MASPQANAMRADKALEQIEAMLAEAGATMPPIPRLHRDREYLRVLQLEAIVDAMSKLAKPAKAKRGG